MPSRRLAEVSRFGLVAFLVGVCSAALAQQEYEDLRASTDPLLLKAKAVDLCFQPPEKASQKEAESLYLEFINNNPNHPLVCYLYSHLGLTYGGYVSAEWKKFGHVKNHAKSRQYFLESVKHHPPDKFSGLLMNAKIAAAALAPTPEEKVSEYKAYYRWLAGMKKEELLGRLWRTEKQAARLKQSPPERVARLIDQIWANREIAMQVAEGNMISIAGGDPTKARQLLDEIAAEFPDAPLGQTAAQKRAEFKEDLLDLGEDRRPPLFATILLAAVLPALLVAGILAWQRIKKARAGGLRRT